MQRDQTGRLRQDSANSIQENVRRDRIAFLIPVHFKSTEKGKPAWKETLKIARFRAESALVVAALVALDMMNPVADLIQRQFHLRFQLPQFFERVFIRLALDHLRLGHRL